jgi:hypothetical protein
MNSVPTARTLAPVNQDAWQGASLQHQPARIYLLVGEREKALDRLEPLLQVRYYYLSPGWLKIDPTFALLRGTSRFERRLTADLRECLQEALHGRCSSSATSGAERDATVHREQARPRRHGHVSQVGTTFPSCQNFYFSNGRLPTTFTTGTSSRPHDPAYSTAGAFLN